MTTDISQRAIRVLQITDTHLFDSVDDCLLGVNTEQSLQSAIDCVLAESRPVDLVIATGDLVHDGSASGYRRIQDHFSRLEVPVYCLPGNHDEGAAMRQHLQNNPVCWKNEVIAGNWLITFLDSTIAGSDASHLSKDELLRLDTTLQDHPEYHALVCLHHQPVPMGSRWLDTMAVDNADDFFAVIDRYPRVRGILWGHVHQQFEAMHNDVKLITTPSTCVQFAPRSEEFAVDPLAPGYRWLQLNPDGRIETEVVRLEEIPNGLDVASGGYGIGEG